MWSYLLNTIFRLEKSNICAITPLYPDMTEAIALSLRQAIAYFELLQNRYVGYVE
ncbi:MAG: hypothetical protein KME05_21535 [Gloeocapsa sp. UFS-A4-WI-NPMV-4B04]|nr:hypothetical protein [Gloeocapsa sp. UFS-A4-WI-NPMV-4B04]